MSSNSTDKDYYVEISNVDGEDNLFLQFKVCSKGKNYINKFFVMKMPIIANGTHLKMGILDQDQINHIIHYLKKYSNLNEVLEDVTNEKA